MIESITWHLQGDHSSSQRRSLTIEPSHYESRPGTHACRAPTVVSERRHCSWTSVQHTRYNSPSNPGENRIGRYQSLTPRVLAFCSRPSLHTISNRTLYAYIELHLQYRIALLTLNLDWHLSVFHPFPSQKVKWKTIRKTSKTRSHERRHQGVLLGWLWEVPNASIPRCRCASTNHLKVFARHQQLTRYQKLARSFLRKWGRSDQ